MGVFSAIVASLLFRLWSVLSPHHKNTRHGALTTPTVG